MSRALAVLVVLAWTAPARAQGAGSVGAPVPSGSLPAGTVSVQVVAGDLSAPVVGATVTLVVGTQQRTATTSASGRAFFRGILIGPQVRVSIAATTSDGFVMPLSGGVELLLSTEPWKSIAAHDLPAKPAWTSQVPPGTVVVDTAAGVPVMLVGYATGGSVALRTVTADAHGVATFDHLDDTGGTAYYALATRTRANATDRLIAEPFAFSPSLSTMGGEIALGSARKNDATARSIDQLSAPGGVAPGKVRIQLEGAPDTATKVELVDASSGRTVARGVTGKDDSVELAVPRGTVFYATAVWHGTPLRSRPFQPLADRGAALVLDAAPQISVDLACTGRPFPQLVSVSCGVLVTNHATMPLAAATIPLPLDATRVFVSQSSWGFAVTAAGIETTEPLRPGERFVDVAFELPVIGGQATWSQTLTYGAAKTSIDIVDDIGVAIDGMTATRRAGSWNLDQQTFAPGSTLGFAIHIPQPSAAELALRQACAPLGSRPAAPVGAAMPALAGTALDGATFDAASLHGRALVVLFTNRASSAGAPVAPLAKVVASTRNATLVVVDSDASTTDVTAVVGAKRGFPVIVDAPAPSSTIGPVALAWGVTTLPRVFFVDRSGNVRLHFASSRGWDDADVLACLKAL